ncbi:hypothetical protein CAEBREN_01679 [Caenorhabditis brenneri]|uniref:Uncharacterized protein n=1 Tax=Caenorhabditis brenneri TaxID=135651 RepID=G0MY71_CAEBE|nr:hypothetical protein CAEBREN_01679 [Caenorhabditis brenneri]
MQNQMEKFRQSDGKSEVGVHSGSPPDTPRQPTTPDDAKTEGSIPINQQKVERNVEPNNQEMESKSSVSLDQEDDAESQASTMYMMKLIGDPRDFNVKKKEANRISKELSPDEDASSGESESEYSISLDDEEEEEKMPSGKQVSDGDVSDEQSEECMDEKSGSPQESERTASSMYLMKVIKDEEEEEELIPTSPEEFSTSSESSDEDDTKELADSKWYNERDPKTALIWRHIEDSLRFNEKEESSDEKSIESENDEEERSSPPESERFVAFSPMKVIREQSVISAEDEKDDNSVDDGHNFNPATLPLISRDTQP